MAILIRKRYTDGKAYLQCIKSDSGEFYLSIYDVNDDCDCNEIKLCKDDLEDFILELNKYLTIIKNENKNG